MAFLEMCEMIVIEIIICFYLPPFKEDLTSQSSWLKMKWTHHLLWTFCNDFLGFLDKKYIDEGLSLNSTIARVKGGIEPTTTIMCRESKNRRDWDCDHLKREFNFDLIMLFALKSHVMKRNLIREASAWFSSRHQWWWYGITAGSSGIRCCLLQMLKCQVLNVSHKGFACKFTHNEIALPRPCLLNASEIAPFWWRNVWMLCMPFCRYWWCKL